MNNILHQWISRISVDSIDPQMTGFYTSPSGLPLKHVSRLGWIRVSDQKTGQHYYGNGGFQISDVKSCFFCFFLCILVHIQTLYTAFPKLPTLQLYAMTICFFCIRRFEVDLSSTVFFPSSRVASSNNKLSSNCEHGWCQNMSFFPHDCFIMMCCYFSGSPISEYKRWMW